MTEQGSLFDLEAEDERDAPPTSSRPPTGPATTAVASGAVAGERPRWSAVDVSRALGQEHPPTDEQVIKQARVLLTSLPVEQVRALTEARFTSMSQDMVSLTIETIADMLGGS